MGSLALPVNTQDCNRSWIGESTEEDQPLEVSRERRAGEKERGDGARQVKVPVKFNAVEGGAGRIVIGCNYRLREFIK